MSVVLVVEDDVLLRAQIARGLHKLPGVDVIEAGTVRESIELAAGLPLDLVVSDLHLPDGSALHLLPHLVQRGARVPAILMSGCIEKYAAQLPEGIKVFEKPLHLWELREAVSEVLGGDRAKSPFGLTDYLQLAGLGRHSVEIDVDQRGEPFGAILIYEGEPWTATDALGSGGEAFMRMLTAADLTFDCTPPPTVRPERSLDGTCESILLETARLLDERRIRMAPEPPRTRTERLQMTTRSPAPPRPAVSAAKEFEQLYADGIDAVLAKKYTEALALFLRAKMIRSTPTLEANLNRLRTMGFT